MSDIRPFHSRNTKTDQLIIVRMGCAQEEEYWGYVPPKSPTDPASEVSEEYTTTDVNEGSSRRGSGSSASLCTTQPSSLGSAQPTPPGSPHKLRLRSPSPIEPSVAPSQADEDVDSDSQ
jgi:predicted SPOUT superfamily RNA methylase MTH1